MDQQQDLLTQNTSLFEMNLDAQNSYNLRSAASWGKVLGVCGILTGAIIGIWAIILLGKIGSYDSYSYRRSTIDGLWGSSAAAARAGIWIFILTGLIFIMGGIFSFNFGNRINASLKSNDQAGLNRGFAALRNYYALRSITLIIILLLLLLSLLGSL